MWEPAQSYPDPALQLIDQSAGHLFETLAAVERLSVGFRWGEGPVWFGDHSALLWSDIPNDRMMRYDTMTGTTSVFRAASNFANGNTRDRFGRLVTCEHGTRRVTRTEYDGSISVLADRFQGRRLNSPNDVVVKSDGTVWFTDPPFGINNDYLGRMAEQELPPSVYCLEPGTGQLTVVETEVAGPNGLAFSPDESILYLADSVSSPNQILAYDVTIDNRLRKRRVVVDAGAGNCDGFRCDENGNLWCGWGAGRDLNGVFVFSPDGAHLARIALPERCANLCFGGPAGNRLFMTASQSLYAVYVRARGAVR